MKNLFLFISLSFISIFTNAQKRTDVKSEVKAATVYLVGAEVDRTASVTLGAGNTNVVFTGLPAVLNQQTINVSANDKLLIQSVQYKLNYMEPAQLNAELKKWNDSLEVIDAALVKGKNREDVLMMEQSLLDDNKKVAGVNTGLNFETLKQYNEYYVLKTTEIKDNWSAENLKLTKLTEIKNHLIQQVSDYQNKKSAPSGEIWVQVSSDKPLTTHFNLSYLVNNAGWTPEYDIRCDNINSPVKLNYKAAIWQTTGEDWKDVQLKLSSGNPSAGASGPVFFPWNLDYYYGNYSSVTNNSYKAGHRDEQAPAALEEVTVTSKKLLSPQSQTVADYTNVTQSTLSTEFDIKIPSTIPSDLEVHRVNIGDYDLTSSFDYYSIPRLDKDVFLNAHVTDWAKLNLLEGTANVFFKGAYVGQTVIRANQTSDTLEISMGRDKNIVLTREKLKDFTKEKFFGGKYRQTVTYEIKVKNTENSAVTLDVMEQIPIPANAEIKVTLEDAGGGKYNTETGKLSWKQSLQPNEEKKMRFSISVEFPESKKVYSPRF